MRNMTTALGVIQIMKNNSKKKYNYKYSDGNGSYDTDGDNFSDYIDEKYYQW